MCCFAARVERMKQAKKARDEKRKEAAEREAARRTKKATTPIRQVARDGNSFYNNRAFVGDAPQEQQRRSLSPSGTRGSADDRMEKSVYNGRVLSTIVGQTRASGSAEATVPARAETTLQRPRDQHVESEKQPILHKLSSAQLQHALLLVNSATPNKFSACECEILLTL